jgi:hypothetical protein
VHRAWFAAAAIPAGALAAASKLGVDYGNLGCHLRAPRCDEAAYPIDALAHGHFATFVHEQPLMGPVTLVLRAPFAAIANSFNADLTWHYRARLFACWSVSAVVALALARRSRARGHFWLQTVAIAVLAFVNPLTVSAIQAGHPEELVTAAAVVAAALLVLDGRWNWGAVVLALAVATKAWALLVVAPILIAVPAPARRRFVAVAVLVVAAAYAPLIAGDPGRFRAVAQTAGSLGSQYGEATAPDLWFFTSRPGDFTWASEVLDGQIVFSDATGYAVSPAVARLAHGLALVLALGLTIAWWRSAGRSRPDSLLLVLAAILVVRCLLDPGDHSYYHAAAALALLVTRRCGRGRGFRGLLAASSSRCGS